METAFFGAGCFWGVQDALSAVPGVLSTEVGYAGGTLASPTYAQVCGGSTGHAETVKVIFDPSVVTYEKLLSVFWGLHDPTTPNRQGPDEGSQYRSVIFTTTPEQERAARAAKARLEASGKYRNSIVTEIVPVAAFYRGEEYHQNYHAKHGGACGL